MHHYLVRPATAPAGSAITVSGRQCGRQVDDANHGHRRRRAVELAASPLTPRQRGIGSPRGRHQECDALQERGD